VGGQLRTDGGGQPDPGAEQHEVVRLVGSDGGTERADGRVAGGVVEAVEHPAEQPENEAEGGVGNHASVLVPRDDRDRIRRFYCEVLGGEITKADPERDFVRLGDDFYIGFLYGDVDDASDFHRSARAMWLEIKSDNVQATRSAILESELVRELEVPDPHLSFQAPGGQCLRLVGADEDLSFYEGAGAGPDMANVKAAITASSRRQPDAEQGERARTASCDPCATCVHARLGG